jgi:hypothetical protein
MDSTVIGDILDLAYILDILFSTALTDFLRMWITVVIHPGDDYVFKFIVC